MSAPTGGRDRGTGYAETEAVAAALDGDPNGCSSWLATLSPAERDRLDDALHEVQRRIDRLRRLDSLR